MTKDVDICNGGECRADSVDADFYQPDKIWRVVILAKLLSSHGAQDITKDMGY